MTSTEVVLGSPSGEQFEISFEDQRAVVVEVGGGLRTYAVGEHEVLDGYAASELCTSGRGQVLIPWPNRIQNGRYEFEGELHQLPLNEAQRQNAIHGLVRDARWKVSGRGPHRVVMEHTLEPQPGYPFTLGLTIEYQLTAHGLSVRTTAINRGPNRCPYGAGAHPYLTAGTETVDAIMLHAPARSVLESDARGIPTSTGPVDGTQYDFRVPRTIGATKLDHAFCDLERGPDGRACTVLAHAETGRRTTLWVDGGYPYLMLFTGDPLPDVARRSLAVEPMTCPPDAFNNGEGLIILDPGTSATASWGISTKIPSGTIRR